MAEIKIETSQNVVIDFKLSDTGDRIFAKLLDLLFLAIYYIGISLTLFYLFDLDIQLFRGAGMIIFLIFYMIPYSFYSVALEVFMNGQTFGKKIMKIRVINLDGSGLRLGDSIMRWLFQPIDHLFYYLPALVSVSVSKKAQRIGDIAAGTTVIKLKKTVSLQDTVFRDVDERYTVRFPNALDLTDKDINTILDALAHFHKTKDDKYIKILAKKTREKLNIEKNYRPEKLLETIIKDYNVLALQKNE
ncbi:MAG: RDD family protein [Cytophagales bacterium]|nr:RDD family protein [Cytophagales bacterium]